MNPIARKLVSVAPYHWSKKHDEDGDDHDIGHKGLHYHTSTSYMKRQFGASNSEHYSYALEVSVDGDDDDDDDDGSYDYAPAA